MPPRQDDDVDWRPVDPGSGGSSWLGGARPLPLIGGFALAITATLAVFLTDNAQYLRIAVVAVAWAFVIATFAAGRRQADRVAAAAREAELHRAYEQELDREVAARREYELELENEIRRESEDSMRAELDALRGDIASLASLRDEIARVAQLRGELAALGGVRDEIRRLSALRDDVAALTALRGELGQVAELRADLGRLRTELVEQLASEMHVERITMRTQASRLPADPGRLDTTGRTLDATPSWNEATPPHELTGGWPAVRLDQPGDTRAYEPVRREPASWEAAPPTTAWPASPPPWSAPEPMPATTAFPLGPPPRQVRAEEPAPRRYDEPRWTAPPRFDADTRHEPEPRPAPWPSRPATPEPAPPTGPPTEMQQPLEWLAARSLLDARPPAAPARPPLPEPPATAAYSAVTPASAPSSTDRPGGTTGSLRVSEILAENGMNPPTGGRRRRRYRDEDSSDDVLSRVLGRN